MHISCLYKLVKTDFFYNYSFNYIANYFVSADSDVGDDDSVKEPMKTRSSNSKSAIIPVPVPVYVPTPMMMYNVPCPVPLILPLPIPVPVFIPTSEKTSEDVIERLKVRFVSFAF